MNCERIKLAKVLYDFGMKVGSVALLCQDEIKKREKIDKKINKEEAKKLELHTK